ncbi:MAG: GIY-YIG nuclease family protein [Parcubacteria group bacterium]|nr:GIY-YIG nuclease family protein [Parcubacteria group bacterium]
MWYVYVLSSKRTRKWYIGSTYDLQKRILNHNLEK